MYIYTKISYGVQTKLRYKTIINRETFNVWILNTINQLPELYSISAAEQTIGIICVQENRYYHSELELKYHDPAHGWTFVLTSAGKNSVNDAIRDVKMLRSPHHLKSVCSNERIQSKLMFTINNDSPCTTIVSCNCTTNANDVNTFQNKQSSFLCQTQRFDHRWRHELEKIEIINRVTRQKEMVNFEPSL